MCMFPSDCTIVDTKSPYSPYVDFFENEIGATRGSQAQDDLPKSEDLFQRLLMAGICFEIRDRHPLKIREFIGLTIQDGGGYPIKELIESLLIHGFEERGKFIGGSIGRKVLPVHFYDRLQHRQVGL